MWNADQYARFAEERRQPFFDLLSLVHPRLHMRILDLGCGTGELTRVLHDKLGARETVGVDSSEEMLRKSAELVEPGLRFERSTIETFTSGEPFDLVFSNAALHWVAGHEELFRRLTSFLGADGQLAIQMPANDDHPSHRTAAAVAKGFGIEPRHDPLLPVERYATLLHSLGFPRSHVRLQVYVHELPSSREVVEWVKGSLLTDYQRKLSPTEYARFLEEYERELVAQIGERTPYPYTYKRILMWGMLGVAQWLSS